MNPKKQKKEYVTILRFILYSIIMSSCRKLEIQNDLP